MSSGVSHLSASRASSASASSQRNRRRHGSSAMNAFDLQYLEGRTLMAATGGALNVRVIDNVLTVTGTAKDDRIMITQSGSRWVVQNGSWRKQVTGNFDGVSVDGKNGNDSIT